MKPILFVVSLIFPAAAMAQVPGVSAERLAVFDDASMPAKEFRVLRTTYEPGAENPKHYHTSHVVFYVLEGGGVWRDEAGKEVTLKPGDSAQVRPGMIHSHRNASKTAKLVFLEFVIAEKGQRSTVPMR
jgi:quercetin dioxygenase-like cupin family protein